MAFCLKISHWDSCPSKIDDLCFPEYSFLQFGRWLQPVHDYLTHFWEAEKDLNLLTCIRQTPLPRWLQRRADDSVFSSELSLFWADLCSLWKTFIISIIKYGIPFFTVASQSPGGDRPQGSSCYWHISAGGQIQRFVSRPPQEAWCILSVLSQVRASLITTLSSLFFPQNPTADYHSFIHGINSLCLWAHVCLWFPPPQEYCQSSILLWLWGSMNRFNSTDRIV